MFEHRVMARASERILEPKLFPFVGEDPLVVEKLRRVAEAFSLLQDMRHVADYDNAKVWTDTDAFREIEKAATAFSAWDFIKNEKIAQATWSPCLSKRANRRTRFGVPHRFKKDPHHAHQQLNPRPKPGTLAPTCYRLTREKNSWPGCSRSSAPPQKGAGSRIDSDSSKKTNQLGWLYGILVLPLWLVTVEASL